RPHGSSCRPSGSGTSRAGSCVRDRERLQLEGVRRGAGARSARTLKGSVFRKSPAIACCLIAALFAAPVPIRAATPQSATGITLFRAESDEDLREGFRAFDEHRNADARQRFDRALARGTASGDRRVQADAHRGIGLVLYAAADYTPAREQFEL